MSETVTQAPAETEAERRKAIGVRLAEGRAKAKAEGRFGQGKNAKGRLRSSRPRPKAAGRPQAPQDPRPAFLDEAPQPEARPADRPPEASTAALIAATENEVAGMYAGFHFLGAWVTGVEAFQVAEVEAREVSKKFVAMCEAWGLPLHEYVTGKIGATINFAVLFGTIEFMKFRTLQMVMEQRQRELAERARQAAGGNAGQPQATNAAPMATGPDAMADPYAGMPEAQPLRA